MTIGAADKPSSPSGIPVKVEEILRSWDPMAIATIRKERQVHDLKKTETAPMWPSMFAFIDSFMRALLFLFVFGLIAITYRMIFG